MNTWLTYLHIQEWRRLGTPPPGGGTNNSDGPLPPSPPPPPELCTWGKWSLPGRIRGDSGTGKRSSGICNWLILCLL